MVANQFAPEVQARQLMMDLHSSNLHYVVKETPYSLYLTVRKRFRKGSQTTVPDSTSLKVSAKIISTEALEFLATN